MKILYIKWRDSAVYNSQTEIRELDVSFYETVGWEIENNKDHITLSREIDQQGDIRGTIVIPRENIIKIKFLKSIKLD